MAKEERMPEETFSKKVHNHYLDVLKGVAIILVVLGHATQSFAAGGNFDNNLLFRAIYSFHMPFFMFLSGAVAAYSLRPMNGDFIKRKAYQLVVPFIAWYLLGFVLFSTYRHINFGPYIHQVLVSPDYGLWFLWALFLNFCFLALIKFLSRWLGLYSYIIVWLTVYAIPTGHYGIGFVKWYLPFFTAGYLAFTYKDKLSCLEKPAMILSIIGFPLLVASWHRLYDPSLITGLEPRLAAHHLSNLSVGELANINVYPFVDLFYKYLVAFCGIGFVYYLFKIKPAKYLYPVFGFLGLFTLDIYVSHQLFLVNHLGSSWLAIFTSFIVALALSFGLGYFILRRIPILSTVFLGGRTPTKPLKLSKIRSIPAYNNSQK